MLASDGVHVCALQSDQYEQCTCGKTASGPCMKYNSSAVISWRSVCACTCIDHHIEWNTSVIRLTEDTNASIAVDEELLLCLKQHLGHIKYLFKEDKQKSRHSDRFEVV